ncbi:MAG: hypothetical protein EBU26_09605 [Verrucomicrobia bacterium]|nr:hypothetical protein [Verrucomicrobiota bacterium]
MASIRASNQQRTLLTSLCCGVVWIPYSAHLVHRWLLAACYRVKYSCQAGSWQHWMISDP